MEVVRQRKKSSAKVRIKFSSVKMRFSKNTNEPTIFDVTTTVKHDDVSMKIIKVSPSLGKKIELQKKSSKSYQKCKKVISTPVDGVLLVYD